MLQPRLHKWNDPYWGEENWITGNLKLPSVSTDVEN